MVTVILPGWKMWGWFGSVSDCVFMSGSVSLDEVTRIPLEAQLWCSHKPQASGKKQSGLHDQLRPTAYIYISNSDGYTGLCGVWLRCMHEGPWNKPWGFLDVGRADSGSPQALGGLVEPGEARTLSVDVRKWPGADECRKPPGCLDVYFPIGCLYHG